MRIIRLLKDHLVAVAIIGVLLVVQANLELALPNYMSDIVDVGIQQKGVDSPVPDTIRESTLADLTMFMTDTDAAYVESLYAPSDEKGVLTYVGTEEEAAENGKAAEAMELPECVLVSLESGVDYDASSLMSGSSDSTQLAILSATPEGREELAAVQDALEASGGKLDIAVVRAAYDAGLVDRDELVSAASKINDQLGSNASSVVSQRAIDFVTEEYEAQGVDMDAVQADYLVRMSLIMFGMCLGALVTTILVGLLASRTAAAIALNLRHDLFERVMSFSKAEVNRFSQASLITRCTNDVQQVQMAVTMLLRMVFLAPIMGIVALVQVFQTASGLEWIIGVAIVVISAVMGLLFGFTMPKFKRMQSLVDRVNLIARDMLDGIMPIRAFGREKFETDRFDDASADLMKTQLFTNRAMSFAMPAIMLVMNLVTLMIVWFGASAIEAGNLQVGTMMAFITYTMQIVMAFMILAMVAVMLPRAEVSAGRIAEVLETEPSIADPELPEKIAADAPRSVVEFDHVGFRYPDADAALIQDVSFTTAPGRMTAIIGSTGSGKSTLVQLIPRLYDATEGSVRIDGVDVRDLALSDLRHRIGYVPQQGLLFSGTIASNISFGLDEELPPEKLERVAAIAQALDFIDEKGGFDAAISQGGTNVSGGQRQRLAIARALALEPEVLVLDDSFSALDYATDAALRRALETYCADTAVVVVAQRVASIMHAAEILVLDEGRVVGRGTHEELLRTCETYREIAKSQLSEKELGIVIESEETGCEDENESGVE
jgi:ATP-binding cassette subfamily B protein